MVANRNRGFKNASIFTVIAIVVCFIGCSSANAPSEEQGKERVNQLVEKNIGKYVNLKSFKKTDGQPNELGGIKGYKMSFQSELEAKKDFYYFPGPNFRLFDSFKDGQLIIFGRVVDDGRIAKKNGDIMKFNGKIYFEKTEKGWQGTNKVVFENKANF